MLKIELEGELKVWDQEGGYCSPGFSISGEDITERLWEVLAESKGLEDGYACILKEPLGRWKLTLMEVSDVETE